MPTPKYSTSPVTIEHGWLRQDFTGRGYPASWETYGEGSWSVSIRAYNGTADTLAIDAQENGRRSKRAVSVNLSRAQAEALRDFLCAAYGVPAQAKAA